MISWYARPADFNPRSHKGSDLKIEHAANVQAISIHAPTRGATVIRDNSYGTDPQISIHAPTRGATISIHAPTRGATLHAFLAIPLIRISIHAPTRGATLGNELVKDQIRISIHAPTSPCFPCYTTHPYFNPRSHKGSDARE